MTSTEVLARVDGVSPVRERAVPAMAEARVTRYTPPARIGEARQILPGVLADR